MIRREKEDCSLLSRYGERRESAQRPEGPLKRWPRVTRFLVSAHDSRAVQSAVRPVFPNDILVLVVGRASRDGMQHDSRDMHIFLERARLEIRKKNWTSVVAGSEQEEPDADCPVQVFGARKCARERFPFNQRAEWR